MKKIGLLFCIVSMLVVSCASSHLTQQEKNARKDSIAQLVKSHIDTKSFRIDVDQMSPLRGPSRVLSDQWNVRVHGDSLYSYLPYFGRAYQIPLGGGKGLNFSCPVSRYVVSYPQKDRTQILIVARNEEDEYHYMINVFDNGSASIYVSCHNRENISFSGSMNLDNKD